jgi:hypothetical protein
MSLDHRVLGGFAPEQKVTLKYVQTIALDPAAGSIDALQFDLRNMFDPYWPSGGHQPSNFDRWMTIYNKYTVMTTRLKVTNAWNSTSSVTPGLWGFLVSATGSQATGFSNVDTLLEQPYVKYSGVPAGQANVVAFPGSITATLPSRPWLGLRGTDVLFQNDYSGDASAGPLNTFYAEVFMSAINGSDPGSVPFRVELEFDAVFFSPKITLPS